MDLDAIWTDLNRKVPYLLHLFSMEYVEYLNAACTVLLGWLVISAIFHSIRLFFSHLTASIIAIILFCPTTMKWLSDRLGFDLEILFNEITDNVKRFLNNLHRQC